MNDNKAAVKAWQKRRIARLDAYKRKENWVTIRGVHVLLDEHGNVINNFKDPEHKLKALRFVDAVSSHTEGAKKVIDAPLQRQTHEQKFNESMEKISSALGGGSITTENAQKRVANALANLEQGAVVNAGDMRAVKLGKGLYKVKGEKGNITAKQLAEKIMAGVKVNEFSGETTGLPTVKAGTNTNVIQKGSKRISHVATNALEDMYNKYKSNKYSKEGLKKLSKAYVDSLPVGSELQVGGNSFTKSDAGYWTIEMDGESHKVAAGPMSNILLNSMKTGYAGGTLSAKLPEVAKKTETKVEKTAEKIAEKEPEKAPAPEPEKEETKEPEKVPASKPLSASLKEIADGEGTPEEKQTKLTDYITSLPDGTSITYEAVDKVTGELYLVKGTKEGDSIKFFSKEVHTKHIAKTILKKLMSGLGVGATGEDMFKGTPYKTSSSKGKAAKPAEPEEKKPEETKESKPEETTTEAPKPAAPAKKFATERMQKAASLSSFDASQYSPEKKAKAKANWDNPEYYKTIEAEKKPKSLKWFAGLKEDVKSWFKSYTGGGYTAVNSALRNAGSDGLSKWQKEQINQMTEALSTSKMTEPTMLRRGVSFYTFATMVGMSSSEVSALYKAGDAKLQEAFLDGVAVENGFSSCGTVKHTGFVEKKVDIEIYCPEGTEAVFANPFSSCKSYTPGSGEYETILQRGSAFKITKIYKSHGKLKVKCEVVAQRVMLDNFGDDISSSLAA